MSSFSIHTNTSAQIALTSLTSLQTNYAHVQKQVSTGYKVADATDNAGVFAVAQGIRSNLASYDSVSQSLNDGLSAVSVAINGATAVSNLITNITATLSNLASGAISTAQRQTYTTQLINQIKQVKTDLDSSTYNGQNLLEPNEGTIATPLASDGFTAVTPASPLIVVAGLNGQQLSVQAQNLLGGSGGTDGLIGLARLTYYVATDTNGVTATANDTISSAYIGYAGTAGLPVARTAISSQEALAALAPLSASAFAYLSGTGTQGVPSVFGSAVANFQVQVNQALGALGASYSNIGAQITFVQSLSDSSNSGLGNLVDANLAQTSARLTALQTQQQLAIQSLSIANSQPKAVLQLFNSAA